MTPTARLKARFSELADVLGLRVSFRAKPGSDGPNYYVTIFGDWKSAAQFLQGFPGAWVTSAGGDVTYGLPRDVVARRLQEIEVDPAWLKWNDSTPLRIARAIRKDRAFDRLPVLADALEEAGCSHRPLLDHCREATTHSKCCWVVELLTGKW